MRKIIMKSARMALAIAVLASVISFTAEAVPGDVKDLSGGCWTEGHRWIAFGEYEGQPILWRILEVGKGDGGSPVAFLLAENGVARKEFNLHSGARRDYSNDWNSSDTKRWLNDDFYNAAFSEKERDAIVNHTYRYGGEYDGSDKEATSKVFLLSTDEAENKRFFANYTDRFHYDSWWLRSPGDNGGNAAFVDHHGIRYDGGVYFQNDPLKYRLSVRPAIKINLASRVFASSSSKYEVLYPVKVEVRDADRRPIRDAEVVADSPKQKYFTGNGGKVGMRLGIGRQKIRVSAEGYEAKEIELDVERGVGITVDMEKEK